MKVLLTGADGQLGRSIRQLRPEDWRLTALGSKQLDITDAEAVHAQVQALRPAVIINAAAYNAVDRAEHEPDRAFAVNAYGPRNLAQAANEVAARLVHVSTDYVFGAAHSFGPFDENALTSPLNIYGESKLQGEQWVLQAQPHALVIRTAWVYSATGKNFVTTMLDAARRGQPLRVVNDQVGAPTFAGDLAAAIIGLLNHPRATGGIYHYSGATALSRYDFARAILETADRLHPGNRAGLLTAIASSDYPTDAPRPLYSVLNCRKMAALGFPPKELMQSLPDVVRAILL
ncbi:MAG TPA: dTDP-4-dehydrorhamnose reductase [Pusillimonas sp.]|uniref:dTDP-4-dehydrorhamnose reductase n=1 Tax=Pusillimonas sp. TaxID=3040095 RepID=UPI002C323FD0|nr:dTDP-4-dehydrorhamnose reductase [Pusillimonas sp.]HUH88654.1 dTDP-4-dehydrorhamnose reductase [Pusillimonas sp.]